MNDDLSNLFNKFNIDKNNISPEMINNLMNMINNSSDSTNSIQPNNQNQNNDNNTNIREWY